MRYGRQYCEGCDYHTGKWCMSLAFWKVTVMPWRFWKQGQGQKYTAGTLTYFLCTTCHAMAEFDWGEKRVPRKTEFSAEGFETLTGHEAAAGRHARLFTDTCKTESQPQQFTLPIG